MTVTVRLTATIKAAIAGIDDGQWTTIEYTDAIRDESTGAWISRAEVAEIPFTAFAAQKKANQVPGRLVVRRIPDANAERNKAAGQGTLFDVWRFHAFFTTTDPAVLDTVTADKVHRHHAIIEHGPRRPEELRPRAPALGEVHRERGLARARGLTLG